MRLRLAVFLLLTALGLASPERRLGIAVAPSGQDYLQAVDDAMAAGMEVVELPQQWKESGTASNTQLLKLLNSEYSKRRLGVVLTLNPLDTMENQIPQDLRHKRYDDPEFLRRYQQFVDATLAEIPRLNLVSVSVGNEVDILLGDDRERWSQYTEFLRQARAHIKGRRPDLPVGVKFTYKGFRKYPDQIRALTSHCDRIMVNYYPVDDNRVRPPSVVGAELERLVTAFPRKRIQLTEVGYPDSARLGSSRALQAKFVSQVFEAWDAHPRIELVNFVWLNDMTPSAVAQMQKTFGKQAPVVHFLSSLGLRDPQGQAKPAFLRLRREAKSRGFGLRK